MAITKLNSQAIPPNTIVESDLSYPLANFSSTGIDDNATETAITIDQYEKVKIGTASGSPLAPFHVHGGSETLTVAFENDNGLPLSVQANTGYVLLQNTSDTSTNPSGQIKWTTGNKLELYGGIYKSITLQGGAQAGGYGAVTVHEEMNTDDINVTGNVVVSGDVVASAFTQSLSATTALSITSAGRVTTGENLVVTGDESVGGDLTVTGNVGINESAPDELLHVKGPDEAIIKIEATGSQFPTTFDGTPKLQLVPMASNGFTGEASIEAAAPSSLLTSTGMWFRAARSDNANNGVYDGGYFTFHDGNQIVCNISDQGIQASTFQSTSGGTTALTLSATGRVSTGENLEVAGDISLPHPAANIDFGGETYGGPHGLNFLTDATGGAIHWGFYYRTSPETITLELDGTDKKLLLNTSGELHIDNDVIAFSTTTSDIRFKDRVETIDSALDKVMALRGVEYTWNATARKGERDMGLIAQEVEAVIPIIVREKTLSTGEWSDNPTPAKTVDYEKLTAVLIEAVKELKAEVDALKGGQ